METVSVTENYILQGFQAKRIYLSPQVFFCESKIMFIEYFSVQNKVDFQCSINAKLKTLIIMTITIFCKEKIPYQSHRRPISNTNSDVIVLVWPPGKVYSLTDKR